MLFLLSPAKNLDEKTPAPTQENTYPTLLNFGEKLIEQLRKFSPQEIAQLMHLSDKLALLNMQRYAQFSPPFSLENAKQALFLFKGDVYEGIDAYHLTQNEINYIQNTTAILSGLYGVLRPLDLMQPYRLEMGTKLANEKGNNLYAFWAGTITDHINTLANTLKSKHIVNLASTEYFKSIDTKQLDLPIITPIFKDKKNGDYKIISFYAKRARGLMIRFAAQNNIQDIEALKQFNLEGYFFDEERSSPEQWVFLRDHS